MNKARTPFLPELTKAGLLLDFHTQQERLQLQRVQTAGAFSEPRANQ